MKYLKLIAMLFLCNHAYSQSVDISPMNFGGNTNTPASTVSGNPIADKLAQLAQSSATGGGGNVIDSIKGQASNAISAQGQDVLNNLFSTQRGTTEIDGSLAPKVGFLLGCLFLMFGSKKQNSIYIHV